MPSYKLVYFNTRGRAEISRWVFAQAGVEYEDTRVDMEQWAKLKPGSPTGTAPYLEVDNAKIGGSGAVSMFLAKEFGLAGSSNIEEATVRSLYDVMGDSMEAFIKVVFCEDEVKRDQLMKEYREKTLPKHISVLAKQLEGGNKWLVGDKVSLADITIASFCEQLSGPLEEVLKANKAVSDLVNRVRELPNIKAWIETRPVTSH